MAYHKGSSHFHMGNVETSAKITPKTIDFPDYPLPIGERVYDPIDRQSEFVRGRTYSGWFKSLYEAESFDSYTGEYQLARLLNISPNIVWWHRLHFSNGAYVYYTLKSELCPLKSVLQNA